MAVASQFSLEEENFYKDIQDLVKKSSQNEKELSLFLERYMDLLSRADIDDETFIINFTKAALIIEASAKVYGTKVDRLWVTLERVLDSLKVKGQQQSRKRTDDDEEVEDGEAAEEGDQQKKLPNPSKRRKKVGEALSSPDDFLEIDISSGLGKSMNETKESSDNNIKFYEKVPNLFIKNKSERRRIDVCLIKTSDDRDDSRLRDWIISLENMLVKEMYLPGSCNENSLINYTADVNESFRGDNNLDLSHSGPDMDDDVPNRLPQLTIEQHLVTLIIPEQPPQVNDPPPDILEEANNNEDIPDLDLSAALMKDIADKDELNPDNAITEVANVSEEIDLRREGEANVRRQEDNLIDVNDVIWNTTKFQDVIPSKKIRQGRSLGKPCSLCADKKRHKKKGKKCLEDDKIENLDTYFSPHVKPVVSDPLYGYLPDEELLNAYKMEIKLIEQLGKVGNCKNINEAYHPEESPEEVKNFLGFDGFDNYLLTKKTDLDDDLPEALITDHVGDDNEPNEEADDGNNDFDVPYPVMDNNIPCRDLSSIKVKDADALERSRLEYQRIVIEETQGAKSCFERNKELGMKISRWHSSLVDKIKSSQERGALNMNVLANTIMNKFPQPLNGEKPVLTFQELVKSQSRKDVPRYFLACLQLTNEGNIDIHKLSSSPLAIDCMALTKLRNTRVRQEFDEYDPLNTSIRRNQKSPAASPAKRKRDISTCSISDSDDEPVKAKKKTNKKQKKEAKSRKRRSSSSSDRSVSKSKKKHKEA